MIMIMMIDDDYDDSGWYMSSSPFVKTPVLKKSYFTNFAFALFRSLQVMSLQPETKW